MLCQISGWLDNLLYSAKPEYSFSFKGIRAKKLFLFCERNWNWEGKLLYSYFFPTFLLLLGFKAKPYQTIVNYTRWVFLISKWMLMLLTLFFVYEIRRLKPTNFGPIQVRIWWLKSSVYFLEDSAEIKLNNLNYLHFLILDLVHTL